MIAAVWGDDLQRDGSMSYVIRAPDFAEGLDWINTGGRELRLGDLAGKIVVLDFWTYG